MTITPNGYVGPTSMFATDLSLTRMPDWVRAATLHRTARMERPDWHTLARMALDVSDLPLVERSAARIIVDWHGTTASSVIVQVSDIARRLPLSRENTSRALSRLVAAGWLSRVEQAGRGSILTLLIPLEGVTHDHTPPVTVASHPCDGGVTPPVTVASHHQGHGATEQYQGHGDSQSDAVPRGADRGGEVHITATTDHVPDGATWGDYA